MGAAIVGINEQTVRHTAHYFPLAGNLIALKVDTVVMESESDDDFRVVSENSRQLVCPKEAVEVFLKGLDYRVEKEIALMTDNLLAIYRREGFVYPSEIFADPETFGATDDDMLAILHPFDAMEKGLELTPVHMDFDGHVLFHPEKDEIYPCALRLEYIKANFSDEKYNLEKALEHLKKRSDVRILKDEDGKEILPIPYYNASRKKSKYMYVTYMPDHEMANQLWQVCKKLNKKFPTCQFEDAIDVLDALGLIEAGIMTDKYLHITAGLHEAMEVDEDEDDDDDEIQDLEEE